MLSISEFAKLCGTTVKTLRFYDSKGLLPADYVSQENGYRYYRRTTLIEFQKISALKEAGFSLQEIKDQLHCLDLSEILQTLNNKIASLDSQMIACRKMKEEIIATMKQEKQYRINYDTKYSEIQISNQTETISFHCLPSHLSDCSKMFQYALNEDHMISFEFDELKMINGKRMVDLQTYYFADCSPNKLRDFRMPISLVVSPVIIVYMAFSPDTSFEAIEQAMTHICSSIVASGTIIFAANVESDLKGLHTIITGFK